MTPKPTRSAVFDLEAAADQATAACGGDAREAVRALLVAVDFLEAEADELRTRRLPGARERKDEADV